jgi:hypothetical protein
MGAKMEFSQKELLRPIAAEISCSREDNHSTELSIRGLDITPIVVSCFWNRKKIMVDVDPVHARL